MTLAISEPTQPAPGDRFGRLVVLRRVQRPWKEHRGRRGGPRYQCRCDCGVELVYKGSKLRKGERTSCDQCAGKVEKNNG